MSSPGQMVAKVSHALKFHYAAIASLAIRGMSVVAGFVITFLIGRTFGPEANGVYALVTQTAMFLSVLAVGGLDLAISRYFSSAAAQKTRLNSWTVLNTLAISIATALLLGLVMLSIGRHFLDWVVRDHVPGQGVTALVLILLSRTITRVIGAVLRAQQCYIMGQMVEVLAIPCIVVIALLTGLATTVEDILIWTAGAGMVVALSGIAASVLRTARGDDTLKVSMRDLWKVALPLWAVAISLNIADWYSMTTAASVLGVREAGLFRVATQIASTLTILSMGLFGVYSPQMSAAFTQGDLARVARLARTAIRMCILFVLPFTLLVVIYAEQLLGLIGPEFREAAQVLRITVIGQATIIISGPAGLVLAMTGNQRLNLLIALCSTGALLLAAPIAAAFGGLPVLAIACALVLVGRNIACQWQVQRRLGINIFAGTVRPVNVTRGD